MRGVTSKSPIITPCITISTHTPHARRDHTIYGQNLEIFVFQLTRLMRGVTSPFANNTSIYQFQLTRLMRGVTQP